MIENTPKQRVLEVSGLAIRAGARTLVQDVTLSLAQEKSCAWWANRGRASR